MGTGNTEHPTFQLGDGCLVDQLVGQYFAQVSGLGLLLDPSKVRQTLQSIYKYNYKRSLYHHESVQRTFALNDEAGLVICDYARGKRPETPFPYFAEIMTGFEYSAAILMLYMDMVPQGLELIENIRRRYDGERRNPWDEAECGHHYARPMAAWAALLALSGFRYHGGDQSVSVAPRLGSKDFFSFWSTGTGWGTFSHAFTNGAQLGKSGAQFGKNLNLRSKPGFNLSVTAGELPIRSVTLIQRGKSQRSSLIKLGDHTLPHTLQRNGNETTLLLSEAITLRAGEQLAVKI